MSHRSYRSYLALAVGALAIGCSSRTPTKIEPRTSTKLTIKCDAFAEGKPIAERHSGYYDNASPALSWSKGPAGTKSFAILVEDPDAPGSSAFVHWLVANIPPKVTQLPEAIGSGAFETVLQGGVQGKNGTGTLGYFGPKPDAGPDLHHYHFRVMALDAMLQLKPDFDRGDFLSAAKGHVLAEGETVGTFARRKG